MKSIGARFLLPSAVLAILFSAFVFLYIYQANREYTSELLNRQAELALEFNLAIRAYAGGKIRPAMEAQVGHDEFKPETMSTSFISRSIFEEVRKRFPGYIIRFSSDNPRNPINQAGPDEQAMLDYFRQNPQSTTQVQEMTVEGERYLAHFRPRWLGESCIRCHGDPKDAPAELLRIYGATGSFHRKVGDLVGLDMVAVPIERLEGALAGNMWQAFMVLAIGLFLLFSSIALVFRTLVTRRLADMAGHFQRIAAGEEAALSLKVRGDDEISALGRAFNRLAEQIRATQGFLESKVNQRTAELAKANEELLREAAERKRGEEERRQLEDRLSRSEKMEALGTLAGGVAHDLNNVLGVLVGYSEILQMSLPEGSPLRSYVDNIHLSGEKGAAIIQDLLTLARRGVATSVVIDLNRVITECLGSPEFEKLRSLHPGVVFRTVLADDLLKMKGSAVHLSKTVFNILANAAEAIVERGEVEVRTENRYLSRPISGYDEVKEGDYVVLTVADTGQGIPSHDVGRIFEPFYTKKAMGSSGTGLGLAVVWGTVKDHQGYIDVESEEGQGTLFTLYFPVCREEGVTAGTRGIPVESYQGRGETILVVDDVAAQRELAKTMLNHLGYQVTTVGSGEEALAYLKTRGADLLMLDMIMEPGMDGLETYRRVLEIRPGQRAIIVSGYAETERVTEAQTLGSGAYVRKPYVMERIGLAVRRELDRR